MSEKQIDTRFFHGEILQNPVRQPQIWQPTTGIILDEL